MANPQLQMMVPSRLLKRSFYTPISVGYQLRLADSHDLEQFFALMAHVGWVGWNYTKLMPWKSRLLERGWFVIEEENTGTIVATAMALQDCQEWGEQGGEIGWVAAHVDHAGKGFGKAVSAAVIQRFIEEGYRYIHLYTEDERLAALKIYFSLGLIPVLQYPQIVPRWQRICQQLDWPFTPEIWQQQLVR